MMIIVSACLAGLNTRHDGGAKSNEYIIPLIRAGKAVPVCPEQLGGLPTPRPKAGIQKGDGMDVLSGKSSVLSEEGEDFSERFIKGAHEVLKVAEMMQIHEAILKDGSPSCGVSYIKRKGVKIKGMGLTAALLHRKGIRVRGEDCLS